MASMALNTLRQCALRLYVLGSEDREWILARLAVDARDSLEPLLDELDQLGFRVDQTMLDSIGEFANPISGFTTENEHLQKIRTLDRATPDWIVATLKGEPPAIRHCLEITHAWSWGDGAAGGVPFTLEAPSIGPTERVRQALVAAITRKMPNEWVGPADFGGPRLSAQRGAKLPQSRPNRGITKWLPWKR